MFGIGALGGYAYENTTPQNQISLHSSSCQPFQCLVVQ